MNRSSNPGSLCGLATIATVPARRVASMPERAASTTEKVGVTRSPGPLSLPGLFQSFLVALCACFAFTSAADPAPSAGTANGPVGAWPGAPDAITTTRPGKSVSTSWTFDEAPLGFERKRLGAGMKVRGWRVKHVPNLYFGQARVGRKWGLGLVMEHGNMAFGMNHRGIEVRKAL